MKLKLFGSISFESRFPCRRLPVSPGHRLPGKQQVPAGLEALLLPEKYWIPVRMFPSPRLQREHRDHYLNLLLGNEDVNGPPCVHIYIANSPSSRASRFDSPMCNF